MSTHLQKNTQSPSRPRSVLGEILRAFVQLALLAIAAVVVLVAFVTAMAESRRFLQAESGNALQAQTDEQNAKSEIAKTIAMQGQWKNRSNDLEKKFEALATKLATKPSEQTPPLAEAAAPARPEDDPLVLRMQDGAQPLGQGDLQALFQLAENDPRRPLIAAALRRRVETAAAPRDFATIAAFWNDAELGKTIVTAYETHPEQLAGQQDFAALTDLGARWRDPRTPALALRCVTEAMTRQGGFPDTTAMHRHGEAFAAVAPLDPELLARHAGANTPAGDVVRGALFRLSRWPDAVVAELEKSLAPADQLFEIALTQWLTEMPPPDDVRDKLFAAAAKQIPRTGVGDVRQDLKGTALLPELATKKTISVLVTAAIRLEAHNPAAARALLLRAMRSHPRETSLILAKAAAEGKAPPPPKITDPWWAALAKEAEQTGRSFLPPVLSTPQWAVPIDAALASVLLDDKTAIATATVAGEWGGELTAAVLEKAATDAPAPQAKEMRTAIGKIRSRATAKDE